MLKDLEKIPFTTKDDLRSAFPYGLLSVPREEVLRLHASSGTTGTPTVIYHNRNDLNAWTDISARSIICTGATTSDVFSEHDDLAVSLQADWGSTTVPKPRGCWSCPAQFGQHKTSIQTYERFRFHNCSCNSKLYAAFMVKNGVRRD